ncbi:MAG: FAD-binding oxidoreductase, partial [Hyphomicrobiales bacterium]|nr:FAD-binding oxidoreductase [Hyphomicrobiales bacterium]
LGGEVSHERTDPPAWSERDLKRNRWLGCQARPAGDCTIKVRLDEHYQSRHRPARRQMRLTEARPITHDISEFRFAVRAPAPFLPGQYALLYLPGVDGGRAYSFCNVDGETGAWSFQIKRVPGGAATGALFDRLQAGDTIAADGPFGMAYLREDAPRDILCIAGGSGLSPMIAIARAAAASPALVARNIHFVYGGRSPRDICGEAMLAELPGWGSCIHYAAAISEPDAGWTGHTGFVHQVALDLYGDRLADFEVYFAGPPAMAEAVQKMLYEAKVPLDQVHFDQFY